MQSQSKGNTRPSVSVRGTRSTPPENAFSALFLEMARRLEASELARRALFAGPWDVEPVPAGDGVLWAVVRKGDAVAEGGGAVGVSVRRPEALLLAAALVAHATPNHLSLNTGRVRSAGTRRRLGFPLHDGTRHLGHLARPEEELLPYLHAVRCLAANPDALALVLEALGPELPAILGRTLIRRVSGAVEAGGA